MEENTSSTTKKRKYGDVEGCGSGNGDGSLDLKQEPSKRAKSDVTICDGDSKKKDAKSERDETEYNSEKLKSTEEMYHAFPSAPKPSKRIKFQIFDSSVWF